MMGPVRKTVDKTRAYTVLSKKCLVEKYLICPDIDNSILSREIKWNTLGCYITVKPGYKRIHGCSKIMTKFKLYEIVMHRNMMRVEIIFLILQILKT